MPALDGGRGLHRYGVHCHWTGSTGVGYEAVSREHAAGAPPAAQELRLSADPSFRGDPDLLNPEQLVVLAAASCQLLSFLAVAARARVDVLGYDDEGVGVTSDDDPPMRLVTISLRPVIRVAPGTDADRVRHLVDIAHRQCFIANSLRTEIDVVATVVVEDDGPG